jgi:hypothetical protein
MKKETATTTTATTTTTASLPQSFYEFRTAIMNGKTRFTVANAQLSIIPVGIDGDIVKYNIQNTDAELILKTGAGVGLKRIYDEFRKLEAACATTSYIYKRFVSDVDNMHLDEGTVNSVYVNLNECRKMSRMALCEIFTAIAKYIRQSIAGGIKHTAGSDKITARTIHHFAEVIEGKDGALLKITFTTSKSKYNEAVRNAVNDVFDMVQKYAK